MSPHSRVKTLYHALRDPTLRRRLVADALVHGAARNSRLSYIGLDYPPADEDVPRYGWGKPPHSRLTNAISRHRGLYREQLQNLMTLREELLRIDLHPSSAEPGWVQCPPWILGLDGVSLYGFVRLFRPNRYVEVGSGNSTKFVARARRDGHLSTHITSIDPHPRAEVDSLCDQVIRVPFERANLGVFDSLGPNDMVFFDGSHRAFMNSDAVVFFLEALPSLPSGVVVGVHDIFLPYDYPPEWGGRYYSEQYLLACYLLADSKRFTPLLPCYYVGLDDELQTVLSPLWNEERMRGVDTRGFTFWLTTH